MWNLLSKDFVRLWCKGEKVLWEISILLAVYRVFTTHCWVISFVNRLTTVHVCLCCCYFLSPGNGVSWREVHICAVLVLLCSTFCLLDTHPFLCPGESVKIVASCQHALASGDVLHTSPGQFGGKLLLFITIHTFGHTSRPLATEWLCLHVSKCVWKEWIRHFVKRGLCNTAVCQIVHTSSA